MYSNYQYLRLHVVRFYPALLGCVWKLRRVFRWLPWTVEESVCWRRSRPHPGGDASVARRVCLTPPSAAQRDSQSTHPSKILLRRSVEVTAQILKAKHHRRIVQTCSEISQYVFTNWYVWLNLHWEDIDNSPLKTQATSAQIWEEWQYAYE